MSVVCGVAAFWTLPDYPHSKTGSQTWSMNEDMRRLAEARMEADRVTGASGTAGIWHGVKLCLVDPKLYLFVSQPDHDRCRFMLTNLPDSVEPHNDSVIWVCIPSAQSER